MTYIFLSNAEIVELAQKIVGKWDTIMETLVISPDFMVEDIHRIREQNYERTRDMTVEEKVAYYNNCGKEAEKEIEQRRALKRKAGAGTGSGVILHDNGVWQRTAKGGKQCAT